MRWVGWMICTVFLLILQGCCCPNNISDERYYLPVHSSEITQDQNGTLRVITATLDRHRLQQFVYSNGEWRLEKNLTFNPDYLRPYPPMLSMSTGVCKEQYLMLTQNCSLNINRSMQVVIEQNTVRIKENNATQETFTLPSLKDLSDALGQTSTTYKEAVYFPYVSKRYEWSGLEFIFFLLPDTSSALPSQQISDDVIGYLKLQNNRNGIETIQKITLPPKSVIVSAPWIANRWLAGNAHTCLLLQSDDGKLHEGCFFEVEGRIALQKLFGARYPIEYKTFMRENYSATIHPYDTLINYTFDEKGNMHLFYNKPEDVVNGNYTYFWYGYFTKENPTTPLFEQKVYWGK